MINTTIMSFTNENPAERKRRMAEGGDASERKART
jgi:hypothetical protein